MNRLWTDVPVVNGRLMRSLACGFGAVLLVAAAVPVGNDGAVVSLSVVPISGNTELVIGIDGAVTVRDFALRNPDRIVVDLVGARLGVRGTGYDRVERGGIRDVRYAQNQSDVVRVVLTLSGPRSYEVRRGALEIRVSVDGGGDFASWSTGRTQFVSPHLTKRDTDTVVAVPAQVTTLSTAEGSVVQPPLQQQQQRRITIAWENADINDVLAAFAAFSGRTIIPSRGVRGTVTAEIIDQPWDVAMKAILNANGYDAIEDANGIIIVNTVEAIAAAVVQRPRLENLSTRTVRFNYISAAVVAEALRPRLSRDCGPSPQQDTSGVLAPTVAPSGVNCPVRGAVTADTLTNTVSITDIPSALNELVEYARSLDERQPQVNIKAKIILVDRTQFEALGLKYDLGSPQQHFNDVITRLDSAGNPESGNVIFLGGNAIAAIANAATAVPSPTLSVVYSAAIGGFQFTSFFDAVQTLSLLDVQAEPSVTTLNYRTASLQAGTQVPVRTIEPGTGGNAAGAFPQVTVQMRQTGIVLTVTPAVTMNRQILLAVHAENSDVLFQSGEVGSIFPTQSIDTELLVADGETAVLGGLTQTSVTFSRTGIPLLIDLPIIGRLFGVTQRNETKRDLLILITPHIVDEGDMSMEPRRSP